MSAVVCEQCAATMPPQITGAAAQAAFEELTHLGVLIRDEIGADWQDVFLTFQSMFYALIEQYEPHRFEW